MMVCGNRITGKVRNSHLEANTTVTVTELVKDACLTLEIHV